MDIRKIKKLIEMLEESNLGEIEIKEGEESIRISRGGQSSPVAQYVTTAPTAVAAPVAIAAAAPPAPPSGHMLTSPMVGTFYRSPSPSAAPFVEV